MRHCTEKLSVLGQNGPRFLFSIECLRERVLDFKTILRSDDLTPSTGAAALSLILVLKIFASWCILLFAARPDSANYWEDVVSTLKFFLSPSVVETWHFVFLLGSLFLSLFYSVLFFRNIAKVAFVLVIAHVIASVYLYNWSFVVLVALPLLAVKSALAET